MSIYASRAVWKYSRAEHGALLTVLAIADDADKKFAIAFPSQATIAQMTRLDERAVRDALRWLEGAGEIETRKAVKRRTRINVYRILLGEFADVDVDPDEVPVRLLEPFSTVAERSIERAGRAVDDRQILPLVQEVTTGSFPRDDRQFSPRTKEGPGLEPETEEANASSVPADAGERAVAKTGLALALSAELGTKLAGMTRAERSAWETATAQLVDAGATPGQIAARCDAYRRRWPTIALTPMALVRHWSALGAAVEISSPNSKVEKWIEETAILFDIDQAHELLDERPNLDEHLRLVYHRRIDERFARLTREAHGRVA